MSNPIKLSSVIANILDKVHHLGECKGCMRMVLDRDFNNEIARKEFDISGLCQSCQSGIMP
jgi:hypothetical protein